ncbi:hypothetical protein [Streptomyces sp. NPDC051567]|uniref:hypothetical protein n=1 Tax=Streptomyces sp. NPDC051567 TaxID=3365660 RepID=UPI00379F035D
MASPENIATGSNWHFNLCLRGPLNPEQSDTLDGLDRFNDGRIMFAEAPGYSRFICSFEAETLTAAIAEALSFFEDFPGVLIRSVELDPLAMECNGMTTPSVVRLPA